MKGISLAFLRQVHEAGLWLFVEADGAKRLPVKAPAEHEPVVVPFSTDVFSVYGLDAVGRRIGDVCFRVDEVTEILGKTSKDMLTAVDIVRLSTAAVGGKKQVTADMRYGVILNKADTRQKLELAGEIAAGLRETGVETIVATSNKKE